MNHITPAIDYLLDEVLSLRRGESLLILASDYPLTGLAGQVERRARELGHQVESGLLPEHVDFYVEPPTETAGKMRSANVILDLGRSSTYYSRAAREAVRRGARAFYLSGLETSEFERLMLSVSSAEVHALAQRVLALLRRSRRIEILSGRSCAVWASLGPPWARELLKLPVFRRYLNSFFDEPSGLCTQPGTLSSLAGQVAFSALRATINGRVRIDGAVFPSEQDCPLREPFSIDIRRGRVVKVEETAVGSRLRKWLGENAQRGAREVMHFSFGLNPAAHLGDSILQNERVFGALTVGIGYGARGAHKDLVTTAPSVWVDDAPLFIDGELVHPEVPFQKSLLTRRLGS